MSPRRPDITFEEAAAVAGIDPDLEKIFDDPRVASINDEKKPLLGRRVTLVITREDENFDAPMTDTVVAALVRYCGCVLAGGAGRHAKESFVFKKTDSGTEIEPILLTITAETYELEPSDEP